ncbi:molybdate transport system substrate-binding protein [Haloactinopolyspora alba]|uniref:Molybdate transport system substrate-binding protein n=1 Tax=Haloactinopolyspora alba TaxID=648780 RepID=A0A2P8DX45_9ACTN|nr:molybdate ABC transporter substrate-binding protein [Haloactinopolyspora alba]PSL01772.1 molybdate transport system substrate-binding protein [Haloactinopolyspora alba]
MRDAGARRVGMLVQAIGVAGLLVACGGDAEGASHPDGSPADGSGARISGEVTVLAAASLTEPFETLGERLADRYPDLEVTFSFGPSSGLAEQAAAGAPADVLATANTVTMDTAVQAGVVDGTPRVFARNTLALAVPAGNPGNVTGPADLARDELRVAVCEPRVPCGAAAEALLDRAGVEAAPDTLTTDVKEAVSLVSLGEVDAALVYLTDAAAAGDAVETVDVPRAGAVVNDYPVAVMADAPNPDGAHAVVDAVTGELGRDVLAEAGFLEP